MMFLMSLYKIFSSSQYDYQAVPKKDDDYTERMVQMAQQWVKERPLYTKDELEDFISQDKVPLVAKQIIQKLKPIYICEANVGLVQKHLIELATQSNYLKICLIKNIKLLNGDPDLIKKMTEKVSYVFSVSL